MRFLTLISMLLLSVSAYGRNELLNLEIFPRQAVLQSSALQDDGLSVLVNPANLSRLERMNFSISIQDPSRILSLQGAALFPYIGVLAAGIYDYRGIREGLYAGWGREILPFLSVGAALKTASASYFDFSGTLVGDAGLLLYPNASMGASFLDSSWIRDRLYFGLVLQNIGAVSGSADYAENFNIRIGVGYELREIWTRLFVEESPLSGSPVPTAGIEIVPTADWLRWLNLRASWDFGQNLRCGLSLRGEDFSVDAFYHFGDHSYSFAFSGFFERSRRDLTVDRYEEGLVLYNEAVKLEALDDDDAFDRYRQALDRFSLAVSYDRGNRKAADYQAKIEARFNAWYGQFQKRAQAFEAKKDYAQALVFYKRAQLIRRDDSQKPKLEAISTNAQFVKSVETRKKGVKVLMDKGKYVDARREVQDMMRYVPDSNGELSAQLRLIESKLSESVSDLYGQAQAFISDQKFEPAIERLNTLLAIEPGNDRARALLLDVKKSYGTQKELETARNHFKRGEYLEAYESANSVLSKNPDSDEASELRDRVKKQLRDNLKANLSAGIAAYDAQKYEQAIDAFDMVLVSDPNNSVALDYKNRALSKLKALKKLESMD